MVPRTLQIEIQIRQRTHKAILLPDRQTRPNPTRVYILLLQPHPRRSQAPNTGQYPIFKTAELK